MRQVYLRVNARTVRCLIDPWRTAVLSEEYVLLDDAWIRNKQRDPWSHHRMLTIELIPLIADGGDKSECDVQLPRW